MKGTGERNERKPRERPWGRRARDRGVKYALALLSAACLAMVAELGTGLGRWLLGLLWAWLASLTGL